MLSGQSVPAGSASSIVVNTHKGNAAGLSSMTSSSFATINKRMQAKIPTSLVQVQAVSTRNSLVMKRMCYHISHHPIPKDLFLLNSVMEKWGFCQCDWRCNHAQSHTQASIWRSLLALSGEKKNPTYCTKWNGWSGMVQTVQNSISINMWSSSEESMLWNCIASQGRRDCVMIQQNVCVGG